MKLLVPLPVLLLACASYEPYTHLIVIGEPDRNIWTHEPVGSDRRFRIGPIRDGETVVLRNGTTIRVNRSRIFVDDRRIGGDWTDLYIEGDGTVRKGQGLEENR